MSEQPQSPPASDAQTEAPAAETLREAFLCTPGPKTLPEAAVLAAKGFCMGVSDIIPGVSGGTIAFITGIYEQLLAAIASLDGVAIRRAAALDVKGVLARVHLRFILALATGIAVAIVGTSRVVHRLLDDYPVQTWSLFFGLILASILFIGKRIKDWRSSVLFLIVGAVGAWKLVGLIPVQTPESPLFLVLCGMIAICAMILPGISGSFLLLILGKYRYVTGAVKAFWLPENMLILLPFAVGALIGITVFSRVLRYCLARYHDPTMALLTGFMIGAMRKVWPWQDEIRSVMIRDKKHVLETAMVLPESLSMEVLSAIGLMVAGFVAVLLLEKLAATEEDASAAPVAPVAPAEEGGDA